MNLPYIGSTRNSTNVIPPIQPPPAAAGAESVESLSMVNGRRKHFVHKYPKNMDSKLMSDILGGPVIEEIKKDQVVVMPRRTRSTSKPVIEKFPIPMQQQLQQQQQTLNISTDNALHFYDADRLKQVASSANLQGRQESSIGDRILLENEIAELRDRVWRQEKGMMDVVKAIEDKVFQQRDNSSKDADVMQILNQSKMQNYEGKLREMERVNDDLRRNQQASEASQKEILAFMRSMQQQESSQMQNLRGMIDEENSNLTKEREKTKALFLEVVRLGENQERQQTNVTALNAVLEEKLRDLEQKVNNGERVASQLAQRGDKSISQVGEVTAMKLQDIMNEIHQLQREQASQKQNIRSAEEATARLEQEMRQGLRQLQSDISSQSDAVTSSLQSKALSDREDRQHLANELNAIIESKYRQSNDRAANDKSEVKERLQQVENMVKSEAMRQQDGVAALHNGIEQQMKLIMAQIKVAESDRVSMEEQMKVDAIHSRDQTMREMEQLKNYQAGVTEKITEMMKQEMQTRLDSDVDLKNLTSGIAADIVKDVNRLKDSIEKQFAEITGQLHESGSECSQRCAKLSTFAEQECVNISGEFARKFDKMKDMFTKLAEQFKSHLVNQEQSSGAMQNKIEQTINVRLQQQAQSILDEIADTNQLQNEKLAGEMRLLEHEITLTKTHLQDRCIKIEQENLKDIEIVKDALADLTSAFNETNPRTLGKQSDDLIAHVEARLKEVINHQNGIQLQVNAFEERVAEIEDSLGGIGAPSPQHVVLQSPSSGGLAHRQVQSSINHINGGNSSSSSNNNNSDIGNHGQMNADIKMIAANQTDITRQLQADIDHLASTISIVDQNRHQQVQEIIDFNQQQQKQMARDLELVRESVITNLKMINETTQTLEVVHNTFEEKLIAIEAEIALEKTINKTDFQGLMANVDHLLSLMKQRQNTLTIHDRSTDSLLQVPQNAVSQNQSRLRENPSQVGSSNSNKPTRDNVTPQPISGGVASQNKLRENSSTVNPVGSSNSNKPASMTPALQNRGSAGSSNSNTNINSNNQQNNGQIRRPSVLNLDRHNASNNDNRHASDSKQVDLQERKLQQVLENIKRDTSANRNRSTSPNQSPKNASITFQTRLNEINYAQEQRDSRLKNSR